MNPGDMVRINLPWIGGSTKHPNPTHDQVGIILGETKRGYKVFVVLLQTGRTESFQKSSLQVINEGG